MTDKRITVEDICRIGVMTAVIEVCKFIMFLPNIELTTFWLILFTLFFGWKTVLLVPVFILVEGCVFGFGTWWAMYLYVWPLLVLLTRIFRKQESLWFWSLLSAAFGLLFGFFCSFFIVAVSVGSGGLVNGFHAGFAWWVAGIPMDLVHGAGNFVVMAVLYLPVRKIMERLKRRGIFD